VACNAAIGSSVREKQAKERPCPPLRSPGHAGAPARGTDWTWPPAARVQWDRDREEHGIETRRRKKKISGSHRGKMVISPICLTPSA
jgi:hypothetical protein